MGNPAAKKGDRITATDTHIVQSASGQQSPVQLPFTGIIDGTLSTDVRIQSQPAATVGSTATNSPPHVPPPGTTFVKPPTNQGRISTGSATVRINGKPAARSGDKAFTCNDPVDLQVGTVGATSTVRIGG